MRLIPTGWDPRVYSIYIEWVSAETATTNATARWSGAAYPARAWPDRSPAWPVLRPLLKFHRDADVAGSTWRRLQGAVEKHPGITFLAGQVRDARDQSDAVGDVKVSIQPFQLSSEVTQDEPSLMAVV
jgi:hypothetical protein